MTFDLICFIAYFAIALVALPVVRKLGPVAITSYKLEERYDSDNGPSNVIYRVVSPVLCCSFLSLAFSAISCFFLHVQPEYRWLPVLMYWVLIAVKKSGLGKLSYQIKILFLEALLSITLAFAVDYYVMGKFVNSGVAVFDQSNLAFQLEVALFYVIVQVIVSLTTRRKYRIWLTNYQLPKDKRSNSFASYTKVDMSEKNLFSYEKRFGHCLPERYQNDILLRAVFFSIMAIEDFNRPAGVRILERIAFPLGLAKTTGIMQQQSDKALSDEDSVVLAVKYISKMWDAFLIKYAQSEKCAHDESGVCFAGEYYTYGYKKLRAAISNSFSFLYGDYCGTYVLNANRVFNAVLAFEERREYGLTPAVAVAQGSLCSQQLAWLSSASCYWVDSVTIAAVEKPVGQFTKIAYGAEGDVVSAEAIRRLTVRLKNSHLLVYQVRYIEHVFASIECYGRKGCECPTFESFEIRGRGLRD